jgi:hypothetical protein
VFWFLTRATLADRCLSASEIVTYTRILFALRKADLDSQGLWQNKVEMRGFIQSIRRSPLSGYLWTARWSVLVRLGGSIVLSVGSHSCSSIGGVGAASRDLRLRRWTVQRNSRRDAGAQRGAEEVPNCDHQGPRLRASAPIIKRWEVQFRVCSIPLLRVPAPLRETLFWTIVGPHNGCEAGNCSGGAL